MSDHLQPVSIATLGDLIDHGMSVDLFCEGCGRTLGCDVYDLAKAFGRAQSYVGWPMRVRCGECGCRRISGRIGSDSRPDETRLRALPENFRASRTAAEIDEALSLMGPRGRAAYGLPATGEIRGYGARQQS